MQELAGGVVDQGVAAVEDGEGRERAQTGGGAVEARGAGGDGSGSEAAEGLVRGVEPAADESKADGGVEALQADGEGGELRDGGAQAAVGGDLEAVAEVVEALGTAADESL